MIKFISVICIFLVSLSSFSEETTENHKIVTIVTSAGEIKVKLFQEESPVTVKNFLQYVDDDFYDGTIFHRVIPNFMIQGGGFSPGMIQKDTRESIINESRNRLHNVRGTISMARLSDPDSASAQFFINQRTNLRLDWSPGTPGYTVFGEVISGMNVVDWIAISKTTTYGNFEDVPIEPIKIIDIFRN